VPIKVSANELLALLRRLFEQVSRQQDDYNHVAESIVWLEMRGLPGMASMMGCLPKLHACEIHRVPAAGNEAIVKDYDAGGNSLITTACSMVDAALAAATTSNSFHATVHSCTQQLAIIPELCRYGRQGYSAMAWWRDETDGRVHVAMSTAANANPDYWQLPGEMAEQVSSHTLMLECSTDPDSLHANVPDVSPTFSATQFAEQHQSCLLNGIEIDAEHYRLCCELADKILVESTDVSRGGAGE